MRRFLSLATLLFACALANVVIAWCSARWTTHWPQSITAKPTPVNKTPAITASYLNDPKYFGEFEAAGQTGLSFSESRSLLCTVQTSARWIGRDEFFGASRSYTFFQFGFPFRSMQYDMCSSYDFAAYPELTIWRIPGWRGGWPLAPEIAKQLTVNQYKGTYTPPDHVYPTTLIPLGFLANTIIYALIILALFLSPKALRRYRSRRHHLCPQCDYPLDPRRLCSECGSQTQASQS